MLGHDVHARRRARRARARAGRPARARHHRRDGRRSAARPPARERVARRDRQLRRLDRRRRRRVHSARRRTPSTPTAPATSRARPRGSACRCCTSRPTTCSTAPPRSTPTGARARMSSPTPPARARCMARPSSTASARCSPPRPPHGRAHRLAVRRGRPATSSTTMLRLAGERDAVQVVDDQVGSPTWTGHLAPALLGLLEREVSGLVHLAGAGEVSWNGFATEIFRQAEVACRVEPASSAQMARPAPRPAWSALESEREDVLPMPPLAGRPGRLPGGAGWDDARMRLLVCGGAGFIGSTFARQRVQRAWRRGDGARQAHLRRARGEPPRPR